MGDFFHIIPGNPAPEKAIGAYFMARDRKAIRYALFAATGRPLKGTVIVLTGRNECIEKYFETIRDITARGFGVATFDWRGQGGSDRLIKDPERGHVTSFSDYVADLDQFFQEIVLPDCRGPYYLLAHSAGALVALLAAPAMTTRLRRMVLIAPFLDYVDVPVSMHTARRIADVLVALGLGRLYGAWGARPADPKPFATNKLTTDPARYKRNTTLYQAFPQLGLGGPTIAWIRAAGHAIETVSDPDFMARIQVPILFVAAGSDEVVSTRAIEEYVQRLRAGSLVTVDGARHEILQEADLYREQFLAAFDAFIPGSDTAAT